MQILLYLFVGIVAIQLFYYLFVFSKFAFAKEMPTEKNNLPVSVIICVKNEAAWLEKNLPVFLNQKYPTFEIVLVDDASGDHSLDIMEAFAENHTNIKLVKVENVEAFWGNRKFALTLGIKAARYENLLFSSIQCEPASDLWIESMSAHFSVKKTIVLGHVAIEKIKKSPFNLLYRFERLLDTMSSFSWAKMGVPYKGDGKNLAYQRSEFFKVRGFNDHMKIRLGEDVLFVNQAATAANTTYSFTNESFIKTESSKKFSIWFNEKRKLKASYKYIKKRDQLQLNLFNSTQLLFLILSILLLLFYPDWEFILGLILIRYLICWIVIGFSAKKLVEKELIIWYPILEIFWIFTRINLVFTNFFSKPLQ